MVPEWLKRKIFARRYAWRRLMLRDDGTLTPDGEVILKDLFRFCRYHKPTSVYSHVRGCMDPIASARLDGRREVALRIAEYLHLDDRHLVNMREGANDND
jgi:hypothetical protein